MKVFVIGGGAAGFFAAINIAAKHPAYEVTVLEKSQKLLQKVRVSGGGRCNVTNNRSSPSELVKFYPRGAKKLHAALKSFSTNDMVSWLAQHGIETKAEADLRVFPITDSSQTIIDCFLALAKQHKVKIIQNQGVKMLSQGDAGWQITTSEKSYTADKVVVATGSSPATWKLLKQVGLDITQLVPSLFTFNVKDTRIKGLQGISFDEVSVKITGSKLMETGPLLITHWGFSGPAVLKLSSWGAYELAEKSYHFDILINYVNLPADEIRAGIESFRNKHPKRKVTGYPLFDLPRRFWINLVSYCGISDQLPYAELAKKHLNKLVEELTQGKYTVEGKSTFKEEFVTAGGVSLKEIDLQTFESKKFPGLYLAGEVLDIDALTGGFNFQACWSAGWIISESI